MSNYLFVFFAPFVFGWIALLFMYAMSDLFADMIQWIIRGMFGDGQ